MQTTLLRQLTGGQYPLQRCVEMVVYVGFSWTKRCAPISTLEADCVAFEDVIQEVLFLRHAMEGLLAGWVSHGRGGAVLGVG